MKIRYDASRPLNTLIYDDESELWIYFSGKTWSYYLKKDDLDPIFQATSIQMASGFMNGWLLRKKHY